MNNYLYNQYRETKVKFDKFSSRLQKSQDRGEFQTLSRGKQNFLISRVKRLWEKLRILEVQLKITTVGVSMAFFLMVSNLSAQDQFVFAPEKNPLPPPSIVGDKPTLIDIDNDGDLDLLLSIYYSHISFYENTGSATVPSFEKVSDEDNPFNNIGGVDYLTIRSILDGADIDDDGDIDIITNNNIFRNTGSNEEIIYTKEDGNWLPYNSDLGDIDGDGDLDILRMNDYNGNLEVYENTGDASNFIINPEPITYNVANWDEEIDDVDNTTVLDIDNDGDLDIVIGVNIYDYDETTGYSRLETFKLIKNNGTAELSEFALEDDANNPYKDIRAGVASFGDLDGDADFDVVFSEEYSLGGVQYFELDNGTVAENTELVPEFYDGIVLPGSVIKPQFVDYDDDGDLDIFSWLYSAGNILIEQIDTDDQLKYRVSDNQDFDFINDTIYIQIPFFVDLDLDGDLDIFRLDYDDDISYTYVENTGSDTDPVYSESIFPALSGFDYLVLPTFVDLDEDGDLDMFFTTEKKINDEWELLTVFFESTGSDPLEFTERTGNANPLDFVRESNYEGLMYYQSPVFSDVDEDGDLDVVFTGYYGIYFFENTGSDPASGFDDKSDTGPFSKIQAGYYSTINLIDMDGDGDDDLFIHSYYGSTLYYENLGGSGVGVRMDGIESLEIYPNPATNELNIRLDDAMTGDIQYKIVSIEGRQAVNGTIDSSNGFREFKINTNELLPGYYFLKVESNEKVYVSKFVKQ